MSLQVDETCDPSVWDQFVSSHDAGNLMQSYGWGEFQRGRGWTPRYAKLQEGEDLRAAALILTRTVPGLGGKVYYAPRGPVVDFADRPTVETFFEELGEYVKQTGGIFLRCDPYWPESEIPNGACLPPSLTRLSRDWSYWNLPRFVFWLDLEGDEETVMGRMTSPYRNEVRWGYRNGVVFSHSKLDGLKEFHGLMALTAQRKGIAFHGLEYYRQLIEMVNVSAKMELFVGRSEGEAITAGISAVYGKRAWLFHAGSAPSSYKLRANRTLQWEMIKWAHAQGCLRYDFRGTATNDPPSPADPGYGVYRFKKSFGPEFTRLIGYYDLVRRPLRYRMIRALETYGLPAAYRVRTWVQR